MAQRDNSKHQQDIIHRYYDRMDTIALNKLQELVSELYMADTEAKRKRLWDRVHKAMTNLKVPPQIIEHIMGKKDVEILAKNLQDWLAQSGKK